MLVSEALALIERELPRSRALPEDPVGTQILPEDREISRVVCAYEINERIVEMAHGEGAGLIVAFHPLIYPSLRTITPATRVERCVMRLIDHRIALHVLHTIFDAHPAGTSRLLARTLGLREVLPLVPAEPGSSWGMGAIGELDEPTDLEDFADLLGRVTGARGIRCSIDPGAHLGERRVRRVAILGGSGMSYYDAAVAAGADLFVTADVRYHGFHAANDRIPVLDPGHAETEIFVAQGIADLLSPLLTPSGVGVTTLTASTNPVQLVVSTGTGGTTAEL